MVKKSIRLEDYIAEIVERKAQRVSGGNFTSYINMLIYNDNQEEIDRRQKEIENSKPERVSDVKKATYESTCPVCKRKIAINTYICRARFIDGHEQHVHKKCCRW